MVADPYVPYIKAVEKHLHLRSRIDSKNTKAFTVLPKSGLLANLRTLRQRDLIQRSRARVDALAVKLGVSESESQKILGKALTKLKEQDFRKRTKPTISTEAA